MLVFYENLRKDAPRSPQNRSYFHGFRIPLLQITEKFHKHEGRAKQAKAEKQARMDAMNRFDVSHLVINKWKNKFEFPL